MSSPTYTKDQLWKLYDKLPAELQEAVFSEETAGYIGTVCERYGLEENKISEVAKFVGRVLMGVLPPKSFQEVLAKEIGLKKDAAQQISHEINRFVFAPVKDHLNQIYHIGTEPPKKTAIPLEEAQESKPEQETTAPPKTEEKPTRPDAYREPLE